MKKKGKPLASLFIIILDSDLIIPLVYFIKTKISRSKININQANNKKNMRKILIVVVIIALGLKVTAQEKAKFRVGLDFGYAFAKGGGGGLFSLEPKYNVTDHSNVGLRIGLAAYARNIMSDIDLDISVNSNILATYDYYFGKGNSSTSPFLGAGLGIYSLASIKSDSFIYDENEIGAGTEFGGMIRGGVEFGKLRLALEYNMVPKTDFLLGRSIKNSYLGASIGFYLGGGKWKK